jgi:hypothetical protein
MNLIVGQKYASARGSAVRVIEKIHGDDIYWRDDIGPGRCSRRRFEEWTSPSPVENPEAFQKLKRATHITQVVIDVVKEELARMQKFHKSIAEIQVELTDKDFEPLLMASMVMLSMSINHLEKEMQGFPGYGKRLRALTRVDTAAESLQRLISPLREGFLAVSAESSKETVTHLLQVLSDVSACLNRLQSFVAPFLVR